MNANRDEKEMSPTVVSPCKRSAAICDVRRRLPSHGVESYKVDRQYNIGLLNIGTMIRLSHALALALFGLLCGTLVSEPVTARDTSQRSSSAKRREAAKRWEEAVHGNDARNARRATDTPAPAGVKNITFSNAKASRACTSAYPLSFVSCAAHDALLEFYVDGTTLPLVDFDVGPSWAGLIPISGVANETRKVHLHRLLWLSLIYFSAVLLALPSGSDRKSR